MFDISDPYNPRRLDVVTDVGFAYWHSATFNNAGDKIVFTDEWGGGGRPRCRAWDPMDWGANAIYDIVDNKLVLKVITKCLRHKLKQKTASLITAPSYHP